VPITEPLTTRSVPGSNESPDYAKDVTTRIASEYVGLTNTLDELLSEAREMPKEVTSDADALMLGALIKRLRDLDSRCESVRELEKEPYLRGGNAVDAFFNGMRDRIGRRNRNDRKAAAGATDILQARINAYQDQKLAEERARREAEERAQREIARKRRPLGSPGRPRRSWQRPSAPARRKTGRPTPPRLRGWRKLPPSPVPRPSRSKRRPRTPASPPWPSRPT